MAAADSLRQMDFEPVLASSGEEALEALAGPGATIVLAMIDIGLPDMRGDTLARRLRQSLPSLSVILSSGYDSAELKRDVAQDAFRLLPKPYSDHQLRLILADIGLI